MSKDSYSTTSEGREPGPSNFSCLLACRSTITIASTSSIPSTGAFRYFTTSDSDKRQTGGKSREASPVTGVPVDCRPESRPGAYGRRAGSAQLVIVQRFVRVFARKPGMHVLPRSAQRTRRQHTAVESEAVAEIVRTLQQHNGSEPGQHATHTWSH